MQPTVIAYIGESHDEMSDDCLSAVNQDVVNKPDASIPVTVYNLHYADRPIRIDIASQFNLLSLYLVARSECVLTIGLHRKALCGKIPETVKQLN